MSETYNVQYRNFWSQRGFGVEFEVSPTFTKQEIAAKVIRFEQTLGKNRHVRTEPGPKGWAETVDNNYWHVKYDSSCGPSMDKKKKTPGWEIASYIACGDDDVVAISRLAAFLATEQLQVNENCGFHVHVNASDFAPSKMGILLSRWMMLEPVLLQSLPKHRRNNKYCRPIYKKFAHVIPFARTAESLWENMKPHNFCPHENADKKVSINTVGYAQKLCSPYHCRPTIELRLPEAYLDEAFTANWIRLFLHFVEISRNDSEIRHQKRHGQSDLDFTMEMLGIDHGAGEFCIFDKSLHDLRVWFLQRIVQFGALKRVVNDADKKLALIADSSNLTA